MRPAVAFGNSIRQPSDGLQSYQDRREIGGRAGAQVCDQAFQGIDGSAMAREPMIDPRPRLPALAFQHRQCDSALQRVQVLAQPAARNSLPMSVGRRRFDLLLDPGESDALAQIEIGAGCVADAYARRPRSLDQIQSAVQLLEGSDAC